MMVFTIREMYSVSLEGIEDFPDLEIVYEANKDNYLAIALKIKEKFGGETKIRHISKEVRTPKFIAIRKTIWEVIEGTTNL